MDNTQNPNNPPSSPAIQPDLGSTPTPTPPIDSLSINPTPPLANPTPSLSSWSPQQDPAPVAFPNPTPAQIQPEQAAPPATAGPESTSTFNPLGQDNFQSSAFPSFPAMPAASPSPTQPTPASIPPEIPSTPSWSNLSSQSAPVQPQEPAPTDLSHLVGQMSGTTSEMASSEPVPPLGSGPLVPNVPMESSGGGIPRWVIGVAAGVLLLVAGTSAYFILGIGQSKQTVSIPATIKPTIAPQAVIPTSTPSSATTSGSFSDLNGSTSTSSTTATSAADLLRLRRGQ